VQQRGVSPRSAQGESDPLAKDVREKPFMLSGCKLTEGCVLPSSRH
jgi:hypothetical protein